MFSSVTTPTSLQLPLRATRRTVLYFGNAACRRPEVLRSAGFMVRECASLAELAEAFRSGEKPDLVCVADELEAPAGLALNLLRSLTAAPLVLFSSGEQTYSECALALEVQTLTHPDIWLPRIRTLLEHPKNA